MTEAPARTWALFIRAVTPGGKNHVPMPALRAALAEAGFGDVRTVIASGNAIVTSALSRAAVEGEVRRVIREAIGPDLAVIARTPAELVAILAVNPFGEALSEVTLLAAEPAPEAVTAFAVQDFAPDAVVVDGTTVYTRYASLTGPFRVGLARCERELRVTGTSRGLRTMVRMAALTSDS